MYAGITSEWCISFNYVLISFGFFPKIRYFRRFGQLNFPNNDGYFLCISKKKFVMKKYLKNFSFKEEIPKITF
jgi:hypothetical protein